MNALLTRLTHDRITVWVRTIHRHAIILWFWMTHTRYVTRLACTNNTADPWQHHRVSSSDTSACYHHASLTDTYTLFNTAGMHDQHGGPITALLCAVQDATTKSDVDFATSLVITLPFILNIAHSILACSPAMWLLLAHHSIIMWVMMWLWSWVLHEHHHRSWSSCTFFNTAGMHVSLHAL